jgi:hypothetical protein
METQIGKMSRESQSRRGTRTGEVCTYSAYKLYVF